MLCLLYRADLILGKLKEKPQKFKFEVSIVVDNTLCKWLATAELEVTVGQTTRWFETSSVRINWLPFEYVAYNALLRN